MAKLPSEITSIINYLRRSRQDEERERRTGEDTLAEQKMLMDRVLAEWKVPYEQRFEIGSGDKIETRPVFKEILQELKNGKWNAIAVKEISRLGRGSYTDMGRIYDLILYQRIYIITPYKVYDPQNNADLRQIRFELFLSREEFETTRERLMGARYNYSMQGKWMAGKVPFGYRFNETTQRLEIVEEQAEVVRFIFDLYANQNLGYHSISTYLKRRGIRTPTGNAVWQPEVLRRMLMKHVYIGHVNFRMTQKKDGRITVRPEQDWIVVKDAHPAIIDEETWGKCQRRLRKKTGKPSVNVDFTPCELASLVTCYQCGHKMVRQFTTQCYKKKNGETSFYEKEFLRCLNCSVYVKYRDVEKRLVHLLSEWSLERQNMVESIQIYLQRQTEIDSSPKKIIERLEQQKVSLSNKLDRAYNLIMDGTFTKEEFETRRDKLLADMEEIEAQVERERQRESFGKENRLINPERTCQNLNTLYDVYQRLSNKAKKNQLLSQVFEEIRLELKEKGKGRRSARFDLYIRFCMSLTPPMK